MPVVEQKKGFPVWGWILVGCGGCSLLFLPIMAAILFPVFARARESARQTQCASNIRQIGSGMRMYANDHNGKLPPAATWTDAIQPYTRNPTVFNCPNASAFGYAMNGKLGGKTSADIPGPDTTIMAFETNTLTRNVQDDPLNAVTPGRHNRGNNTLYADWHVALVPR